MGKWGLDCELEENTTSKIKLIKDRWIKARLDLEEAKYIENLIHLDFIRTIKNYRTIWDYRLTAIKTAVDELKITDRRKKTPNLDFINSCIKEDFFPEVDVDIKVNNIVSYGFEGYHWQISFNIKDETYSIGIPDRKQLNSKNLSHGYEGKFVFMHIVNECLTEVEYTDYTEEGMSNFIKSYFMKVL